MKKTYIYTYTLLTVLTAVFIKIKLLDKNLFSIDSKDFGNNIFFWVMTLVFIFTIVTRVRKDKKVLEEIEYVMNDLKDVSLDNINSEFQVINNKLLDNTKYKNISEIWNSYNDTIMILKDGKVCQTVDAELFYNSESLMKEKMNFKLLNYIPQLLVGLGLLGTFFGLSIGLSGLDLSSNDKQQLNELIEGTKTAFYTSLYGMYYSIIISVILNNYIGNYESLILKMKEKINSIFHKYIGNETMEDMKNEIIVLRESQQKLSESVGIELVQGVDKYNKINEKYMKQLSIIVNNNIEGLAEKVSKSFEVELSKVFSEDFVAKFNGLKEELVKFSKDNNKSIQQYSKEMMDISGNFSLIGEKVIKFNQETLVTFQTLMDRIKNEYSSVNKLLIKSENNYLKYENLMSDSSDIIKSSNNYLGKIENITNTLNKFIDQENSLIKFWDSNKDVLDSVSATISKNILSYNKATETNSTTIISLIKETKDFLLKLIEETNVKFSDTLNKQVGLYEKNYEKGLTDLFSSYDTSLSKVINSFNSIIGELVNSSLELKSTTDIISKNIVNANDILNSTYEKQLEQNEIENTKYKGDIEVIANSLKDVIDEFKKQSNMVNEKLRNNTLDINEVEN